MGAKNKECFDDVIIMDGGVSWLTCVYELLKAEKRVIVLEDVS